VFINPISACVGELAAGAGLLHSCVAAGCEYVGGANIGIGGKAGACAGGRKGGSEFGETME